MRTSSSHLSTKNCLNSQTKCCPAPSSTKAGLLTIIGLSHAEDVACCAALCVPDDDKPADQAAVADDPLLAIVLPGVLNFNGNAFEDKPGIVEVESSFQQCLVALGLVEGDLHPVSVATLTEKCN